MTNFRVIFSIKAWYFTCMLGKFFYLCSSGQNICCPLPPVKFECPCSDKLNLVKFSWVFLLRILTLPRDALPGLPISSPLWCIVVCPFPTRPRFVLSFSFFQKIVVTSDASHNRFSIRLSDLFMIFMSAKRWKSPFRNNQHKSNHALILVPLFFTYAASNNQSSTFAWKWKNSYDSLFFTISFSIVICFSFILAGFLFAWDHSLFHRVVLLVVLSRKASLFNLHNSWWNFWVENRCHWSCL